MKTSYRVELLSETTQNFKIVVKNGPKTNKELKILAFNLLVAKVVSMVFIQLKKPKTPRVVAVSLILRLTV